MSIRKKQVPRLLAVLALLVAVTAAACGSSGSDKKATVGKIMRRRRSPVEDQRADKVAILALLGEIDRRRRPLFLAAQLTQIH